MKASALVVLLERNPIQREGIVAFLRSGGFSSCIACRTIDDLYKIGPETRTKVLFLVDLDHEDAPLRGLVSELHSHYSDCAVVVLADACSTPVLRDVARSGADGLLLKQIEAQVLVKSLELVLLGEHVFPAAALTRFFETDTEVDGASDNNSRTRLARLSGRERQVLLCLEAGHSNKEIARTLEVTESTVKVHVKAILRKIFVKNRTQAAVWSKRARMHLTPEDNAADAAPRTLFVKSEQALPTAMTPNGHPVNARVLG